MTGYEIQSGNGENDLNLLLNILLFPCSFSF
jgi:hypothetical protein